MQKGEMMDLSILNLKIDTDYEITESPILILDGAKYGKDDLITKAKDYCGARLYDYYFFNKECINNYIVVIVNSHSTSALETSMYIANRTEHKLKHFFTINNSCVIILKKKQKANKWK